MVESLVACVQRWGVIGCLFAWHADYGFVGLIVLRTWGWGVPSVGESHWGFRRVA